MSDPGSLEHALDASLTDAQLPSRYDAGAELARQYARLLDAYPDDTDTFKEIGPKYLAALGALGLTLTAARGGEPSAPTGSALDELRRRREQRAAG